MNILFLSPENPYPLDGGHHLRTFNVLRLLAQHHKIYFVGFAQNNDDFYFIPQLKKFCDTVDLFPIAKTGFNLRFLMVAIRNLFSRDPLIARRYYLPQAEQRIQYLLEHFSIDLVHIDMLALARYKFIFHNLPVFLTNHNVESLRLRRWSRIERSLWLRVYLLYQYIKLKDFEKNICPQFNQCIVVSQFDRDYLERLCCAGNFVIIPNGVDTDYFKPIPVKEKQNHLVWVGGMSGPYNADTVDFFLREIWPLILRDHPAVTIDFIGLSPTPGLRQMAGEDHRIRAFGFVDDVRPHVQRASVFVAPIRSGSGTKIKVLNAMAQGKAVVATHVAAEGIDAKPGKEIVLADDPVSFAQSVVDLLANQSHAREIGRAARKMICEKYGWDVIHKSMIQLYRSSIIVPLGARNVRATTNM